MNTSECYKSHETDVAVVILPESNKGMMEFLYRKRQLRPAVPIAIITTK